MYSVELVQAAIQQCLARRGFKYPRHNERGKDSNTARMLAFDAMFALTGGSVTGSAVNVNASTGSGKALLERTTTAYRSKDERNIWIAEVRSQVQLNIQNGEAK